MWSGRAFEIKAGETSGGGAKLEQLTMNRIIIIDPI
jgi:hypothetical protein